MSRRPLFLLALAAASAACALAVYVAAVRVSAGEILDARALLTFTGVAHGPLTPRIQGVALLADPLPFLLGAGALVVLALLRRRWLMAAVVPAVLLTANATTQWLKPALGDVRVVDLHGVDTVYLGSWPSGHSTAAMSLALCLVLVSGPRLRSLAALAGAGYAVAVGYALVVLGYHLPSDVLGGFLVAATFTLLGAAALAALEERHPARAGRQAAPPAPLSAPALAGAAAMLAAVAAAALLISRPETTLDVLEHPTAVLAGLVIAALGVTLTAGLARVLRR